MCSKSHRPKRSHFFFSILFSCATSPHLATIADQMLSFVLPFCRSLPHVPQRKTVCTVSSVPATPSQNRSIPTLTKSTSPVTKLNSLISTRNVKETVTFVEGLPPSQIIDYRDLHQLIEHCNKRNEPDLALRTFNVLERMGYAASRSTSCILFQTLAKHALIKQAEVIMEGLWHGSYSELEMQRRRPDEKMVTQVANSAVNHSRPDAAVRMLERMEVHGLAPTVFSTSVLLKAYGRLRMADKIQAVMEKAVVFDVVVYNSAIHALILCGERQPALKTLSRMYKVGLQPNSSSFHPIMVSFAKDGMVARAFEIMAMMEAHGIPSSPRSINALMTACVNSKDINRAVELFENVKEQWGRNQGCIKDILVGYTILISAHARNRDMTAAEEQYDQMVRYGKGRHDRELGIAATAILSALLASGDTAKAWRIFREAPRKRTLKLPVDMYNAFIRGFCKRGNSVELEAAQLVFDQMKIEFRHNKEWKKADMALAYNDMINGFVQCGMCLRAEELIDEMEAENIPSSAITYTTMINGYGMLNDIFSVRQMFHRMRDRGIEPDIVTMNAFLGACIRNDDLELSLRIFDEMQRLGGHLSPNLVSFSAIIAGHLRRNKREDAWELYEEMKAMGVVPNERLLDRMMAAFVDVNLRPTRGEIRKEDTNHEGEDLNEVVSDEDFDELAVSFEGMGGGGGVMGKARVLIEDMKKCRCSDISRRRWAEALRHIWD